MWDLPGPEIEPMSPDWQADSQPLDHWESPHPHILNSSTLSQILSFSAMATLEAESKLYVC